MPLDTCANPISCNRPTSRAAAMKSGLGSFRSSLISYVGQAKHRLENRKDTSRGSYGSLKTLQLAVATEKQ
jgi:hypothetical protein